MIPLVSRKRTSSTAFFKIDFKHTTLASKDLYSVRQKIFSV